MAETESPRAKILIVDDVPANIRMLEGILEPRGYAISTATNGREALDRITSDMPDLVLTDIVMPIMDGYDLCRKLRSAETTRLLPVIMITASGEQEKLNTIDAGADDFIVKPLNRAELLARVRSLLRVKDYQDQLKAKSLELAEINRTLEQRVTEQVTELERLNQLRRFLSPPLAEAIMSANDQSLLEDHRRHIAVVFADLRGFTAFSETAEPEELMAVLREYHEAAGAQVRLFEGTVGFFAGDGLMVFFNDPVPCPDPAARAVRMAVGMRRELQALAASWHKREYDLGFGAGIAMGYATLGKVGFEGRFDYTAIGSVVNQASRLCAEAGPGQILITQRVLTDVEQLVNCEHVGDFELKGFHRSVSAYNVVGALDPTAEIVPT
ncbi:MAG TPA: response regulator [Chloroflexota bacterium]|nr:response regulator [Chloroflexota bacterium]